MGFFAAGKRSESAARASAKPWGSEERLADGAALDRVHAPNRQPLELVEQIEPLQDAVLHFARVARIGGLVQRGLDGERAHPVAGSGPAKARVAL